MLKLSLYHILFSFLAIFLLPAFVYAASASSLVEAGNEAFSHGDYAASLEKYEKAAESNSDAAVILFNKGDALYRQKKFAEAFNAFEEAAAKARVDENKSLEAQSRYNMGNSTFRKAEKLRRKNPQLALEDYKRSSGYYRSAVQLDPNLAEAAHNLEVSRMAAKQIEDFIQQQQKQAQQEVQQKKEIAKDLANLQRKQQQAAEQSKDLAQAQQQKGEDSEVTQQSENQKSITAETRDTQKKLAQLNKSQSQQPQDEMAREHLKRAVAKQEEAEKNLQKSKPEAAHENQEDAARELQKALQQLTQVQDKEQNKDNVAPEQESQPAQAEQRDQQGADKEGGESHSQPPSAAGSFSGESPEDIINEEIENQKYRSVRGSTGYKAVDRDW